LAKSEKFLNLTKDTASRSSSGEIINIISDFLPNFIGGSADLAPSNKTNMKGKGDFSKKNREGRNLHFGIREHAMSAIANGIYLHGGLRIFVSTFFVFSDYMKAGMRLSAMMRIPVTYVLTHDSIAVGEDGPTHEPIEHLAALRSIPNFVVFRPADSKETAAGWLAALKSKESPFALVLSRQNLPTLGNTSMEAAKGAYVLTTYEKEPSKPDIILIASGSEVSLIMKAAEILHERGINARVVSMPSFELFERQSPSYKERILPDMIRKRFAVEAASSFGWHKYTGLDGEILSVDHFGESGRYADLFKKYGFTPENIAERAYVLFAK
jgi:transketolase